MQIQHFLLKNKILPTYLPTYLPFTLLHSQLKRSHLLVQLIEQCLSNNPKKRPTAGMILEIINKLNSVSEHKQLSAKIKTMEMIMRSRDQEENEEIEKVNLYRV